MNGAKNILITLNVLMTVELSSLKIGKTSWCKPETNIKFLMLLRWLDENQANDNRIPNWQLKKFDAHDLCIQNIWCLTQKINHVFDDDKYYCLFFIYMKQLSPSSYMTAWKTLHIKSCARLFRWSVYWSLDCQICTLLP